MQLISCLRFKAWSRISHEVVFEFQRRKHSVSTLHHSQNGTLDARTTLIFRSLKTPNKVLKYQHEMNQIQGHMKDKLEQRYEDNFQENYLTIRLLDI